MPVMSPPAQIPGAASRVWSSTLIQPFSVVASPCRCEVDAGELGPAAHGDQQALGCQRLAALEVQGDPSLVLGGLHGTGAEMRPDAVRVERLGQLGTSLRLLAGHEPLQRLDDVDLGAEARERLGQLGADRTAPENQHQPRQLAGERRLAVGPVVDAIETRDGRDRRRGAGADDDPAAGGQRPVPDQHGARAGEVPLPADDLRALFDERLRGLRVVLVARYVVGPLSDLGEGDVPLDTGRCQCAGAVCLGKHLGGAQEGLARDAAPVRALAADELPLDHRERDPRALQLTGHPLGHRAGADADDVELVSRSLRHG